MDAFLSSDFHSVSSIHCGAFLVGVVGLVVYVKGLHVPWRWISSSRSPVSDIPSEQLSKGHFAQQVHQRALVFSLSVAAVLVCAASLWHISWTKHQEDVCIDWSKRFGVDMELELPASRGRATSSMTSLDGHPRSWVGPNLAASEVLHEVENGRRSHTTWLPLCKALGEGLQAVRVEKHTKVVSVDRALRLLVKVHAFHRPFRQHLENLGEIAAGIKAAARGHAIGETGESDGGGTAKTVKAPGANTELEELANGIIDELRMMRTATRTCMLEVVREARLVAAALPRNDKTLQQALACRKPLLADLESFVLAEADRDDADEVVFALGLHWSEISVLGNDVPLFGTPTALESAEVLPYDKVTEGSVRWVPAPIARAEMLMLQGEEAGVDATVRTERRAKRALRIYQHAKHLAFMHHDAAAESRYLVASDLAARGGRIQFAGHTLTRLSYFLSLRGRAERAREVAEQALVYGRDPLAEYLLVTLRRTLGMLHSDADVYEAEEVLRAVAGRLPSKNLEQERAEALRELELARRVASERTLSSCLQMQDAPRILTCVICHYVFPDSGPLLLPTTAEASGHLARSGATEVSTSGETGSALGSDARNIARTLATYSASQQRHWPRMSLAGEADMRKQATPWVEDSDGGSRDLELIAPWDYAEQTEESNAKADVGSEDLELIAPWDYAEEMEDSRTKVDSGAAGGGRRSEQRTSAANAEDIREPIVPQTTNYIDDAGDDDLVLTAPWDEE